MSNCYTDTWATERDLEAQENALLRQHNALGRHAECYTETQIARQDRDHEAALTTYAIVYTEELFRNQASSALESIMWRTVERSLKQSGCPARATRCLDLWIRKKYSYRQIAAMPDVDCDYTNVCRDVQLALRLLRADGNLGLLELLFEVFGKRMVLAVIG